MSEEKCDCLQCKVLAAILDEQGEVSAEGIGAIVNVLGVMLAEVDFLSAAKVLGIVMQRRNETLEEREAKKSPLERAIVEGHA